MLKQFDMSRLHTPQRQAFQLHRIKGKNVHQEIKQSRISSCKYVNRLKINFEMYALVIFSNEIHVQKLNVEIS